MNQTEFTSTHPMLTPLIKAGELEVSPEHWREAADYFSDDYRFHGPGGLSTDYQGLSDYFASLRAAFPDLIIWRVVAFGEGPYMAARTAFRGTFQNTFTMSPVGEVLPNGRSVEWEVMNIFRYDEKGRIAEEWVQMDATALANQLAP